MFATMTLGESEEDRNPFGKFRHPSLGMLACPPEIPSGTIGIQLLYCLENDFPFIGWGEPGGRYKTAFIDFINDCGTVGYMQKAMRDYMQELDPNRKNISNPLFLSYKNTSMSNDDPHNAITMVESLKDTIQKERLKIVFLHGISGYFRNSFFPLMAALKGLTMEEGTCVIITHVIASVVYGEPSPEMFRGPLSYKMVRDEHLESMGILDWSWFIAPATQASIQAVVKAAPRVGAKNTNVSYYANKMIQMSKQTDSSSQGLFYTYKQSKAPILLNVELEN